MVVSDCISVVIVNVKEQMGEAEEHQTIHL